MAIPIVAYYTPNYAKYARALTAKQPGVMLLPMPDSGNWLVNELYKPRIIKKSLEHFNEVVYLDVDSDVLRPIEPVPLPKDKDIGLVKYDILKPHPYSASIIQIKRSLNTGRFLDAWIQCCDQIQQKIEVVGNDITDHNALMALLSMVLIHDLPSSWMYVKDLHHPMPESEIMIRYRKSEV